jgi:hypothetical protein
MSGLLLFPTLITQEEYDKKELFKETVFRNIHKSLSSDGYSHERTGHVTLHHEEEYSDLFKFVTSCAKRHIEALGIDPSIYAYNVVKTWFNITKTKNNPKHSHADAHLSFAYYVNTPQEAKKMLCFFAKHPANRLYEGMLSNVHTYNVANADSWSFPTTEGQLFMFPAATEHAVISSKDDIGDSHIANVFGADEPLTNVADAPSFRIVIAGDIILTHREKAAVNLGLQPVENWKTFE